MDLSRKVALVVDDEPTVRMSLRTQLSNLGLTRIGTVGSAAEAVFKIKSTKFDIILCDYYLGDGRDGQQLLEELRFNRMLPLETIFIMVTSENRYNRVVAAAEYAPDDYLLKPFTSTLLEERIRAVFAKKQELRAIHAALDAGDYRRTLDLIEKYLAGDGNYVRDMVRLRAEVCLRAADYEQARAHFDAILEERALPWAQLGLGKALYHLGDFGEAEKLFAAVVESAPQFLEGYDWLAKTHEQAGRDKDAQQVIEQAIRHSPYRFDRHGLLGRLAYRNEDLDTAQNAFCTLLDKGRHSYFHTPEDHAHLAQVYLDKGDAAEALRTLKEARTGFNTPEARFCAALMESRVHERAGNGEAAKRAFAEAMEIQQADQEQPLGVSDDMRLHFACECIRHGREDLGAELLRHAIQNTHRRDLVQRQVERTLAGAPGAERFRGLLTECEAEISQMHARGMDLARSGRWDEAIGMLTEAVRKLPKNPEVALNAAQVILMNLEKTGWDASRFAQASDFIERAASLDPSGKRMPVVRLLAARVKARFDGAPG